MSDATSNDESNERKFSLAILETVKLAQMQNGLRHNNYMRYRQYCTRRLARLRRSVKFTHAANRSGKFKQRVITAETVTNVRFLTILLVNAERAWSYAMQLKQGLTEDTPRYRFHLLARLAKATKWSRQLEEICAQVADTRTHLEADAYATWMHGNLMLEREEWGQALLSFGRAKATLAQLARINDPELRTLCQERMGSLEPNIRYCKYVLKEHGDGDDDDVDLDELLELESSAHDALLQSKLHAILEETRHQQAKQMSTVMWKGQQLVIKNEKTRMAIIKARELSSQVQLSSIKKDNKAKQQQQQKEEEEEEEKNETKASPDGNAGGAGERKTQNEEDRVYALFGSLFSCYDDAVQQVRSDMRDAEKGFKGNSRTATVQNLQALKEYLTFHKQRHMMDRNTYMAQQYMKRYALQEEGKRDMNTKKVRPDDLINLYEKMTQALDMLSSSGSSSTTTTTTSEAVEEEDEQLRRELDAKKHAYQAFRCFFVGETYKNAGKYAEAYALYGRCAQLVATAIKKHRACTLVDQQAIDDLSSRAERARALQYVVHAAALLAEKDAQLANSVLQAASEPVNASKANKRARKKQRPNDGKSRDSRTLKARLADYSAGDARLGYGLTELPPAYASAPAKPILFDLALNYIAYPSDLSKRYTKKQRQRQPQGNSNNSSTTTADESKQQQEDQGQQQQQQQQQQQGSGLGGWFSWMSR